MSIKWISIAFRSQIFDYLKIKRKKHPIVNNVKYSNSIHFPSYIRFFFVRIHVLNMVEKWEKKPFQFIIGSNILNENGNFIYSVKYE